ncbi:MAG: pyridoxamine 5'-phosphate oxidase family protein [Clostridiales bacterium]|nr:pyridoxamine 5'-phosphate oxidase family protein [Clostridiales bacterium]
MTNVERVEAYLQEAGTFFYATCDGNKPRVRPFGFHMVYNGKLYFGMGKQKESFKQTVANENFEICAVKPDMTWIRIRGTAVLDDSAETMAKVFEVSPHLTNLYNEQTGNVLGNFYIKDGYAEITSMSGSFESFEF